MPPSAACLHQSRRTSALTGKVCRQDKHSSDIYSKAHFHGHAQRAGVQRRAVLPWKARTPLSRSERLQPSCSTARAFLSAVCSSSGAAACCGAVQIAAALRPPITLLSCSQRRRSRSSIAPCITLANPCHSHRRGRLLWWVSECFKRHYCVKFAACQHSTSACTGPCKQGSLTGNSAQFHTLCAWKRCEWQALVPCGAAHLAEWL